MDTDSGGIAPAPHGRVSSRASSALAALSILVVLLYLVWRFIWQCRKHGTRSNATGGATSSAVLPASGRGGGLRTASRNDGIAALALGVGARGHGTQRRGRQGRVRGVPCGARGRRGRYAARAGLRSRVPRGVHPGVVPSEHDVPALPRRRTAECSTVRHQRVTVPSTILSPPCGTLATTRRVALRIVD